jgi:hypothetical protein
MFRWLRLDPKHLRERRQSMRRALVGYPVYDPPHSQRLPLSNEQGQENFRYFLEHREARMAALSAFLEKFDVKMGFDDVGLAAVSAWCPGHFGSLARNLRDHKTGQIFFMRLQPWTEQWHGLNVIFDLGIFVGESIIARNPRLHWAREPGLGRDGVSYGSGYIIDGFKKIRDWLDPMTFIFRACGNDEEHSRSGKISFTVRPDLLVGKVRDFSTR